MKIDNKNIYDDFCKLYDSQQRIKKENYDPRVKEVGDRVILWDYSYNEDVSSGKHYRIGSKLHTQIAIVAATNINQLVENDSLKIKLNKYLNTIIWFPNGISIYTHSDFIKLI